MLASGDFDQEDMGLRPSLRDAGVWNSQKSSPDASVRSQLPECPKKVAYRQHARPAEGALGHQATPQATVVSPESTFADDGDSVSRASVGHILTPTLMVCFSKSDITGTSPLHCCCFETRSPVSGLRAAARPFSSLWLIEDEGLGTRRDSGEELPSPLECAQPRPCI